MVELVQAYWPVFALIAFAAMLLVLWLASRSGKKVERSRTPDVLDEGAAPAQRNQALIDAPSAAGVVTPVVSVATPDLARVGEDSVSAPKADAPSAPSQVSAQAEPAVSSAGDDLTRIKGLGPKLVTLLGQLGIMHYAQIASWTEADIDRIDAQLGTFQGRIRRDSFVEQARFLEAGDVAGFEGKFGRV